MSRFKEDIKAIYREKQGPEKWGTRTQGDDILRLWVWVVNVFILATADRLVFGHQNKCSLPFEILTNSPMKEMTFHFFIFERKVYFINEF